MEFIIIVSVTMCILITLVIAAFFDMNSTKIKAKIFNRFYIETQHDRLKVRYNVKDRKTTRWDEPQTIASFENLDELLIFLQEREMVERQLKSINKLLTRK